MPARAKVLGPIGSSYSTVVGRVGAGLLRSLSTTTYRLGVIAAILMLAVRPRSWTPAVREVFARQILFTGVEAQAFALRISVAVGVLTVVQANLWLRRFGSEELMGTLLLNAIVRELAPLLANFVVIVRSGTAIATELANMQLDGEVEVLDSQGIDPMTYLVMPRALATSISVFCLGVLIVAGCFVSGYVVGALLGVSTPNLELFMQRIVASASRQELYFFLPKTLISGLFIGAICSVQGLSIRGAKTEVPKVASRGTVLSLTAVFTVAAILSLAIYGTVLAIEVL